jgi:hypothetical protein
LAIIVFLYLRAIINRQQKQEVVGGSVFFMCLLLTLNLSSSK